MFLGCVNNWQRTFYFLVSVYGNCMGDPQCAIWTLKLNVQQIFVGKNIFLKRKAWKQVVITLSGGRRPRNMFWNFAFVIRMARIQRGRANDGFTPGGKQGRLSAWRRAIHVETMVVLGDRVRLGRPQRKQAWQGGSQRPLHFQLRWPRASLSCLLLNGPGLLAPSATVSCVWKIVLDAFPTFLQSAFKIWGSWQSFLFSQGDFITSWVQC